MKTCTHPEHRALLAKVLKQYPEVRKFYKTLKALGMTRIRPDTRLDKQPDGTYRRSWDEEAWNVDCRNGIFVCLLRKNGEWSLHS